jgi:hypothetical protein
VKNQTVIFSVWGQIESVIADAMVEEGSATRIPPYLVPRSVRYNDKGEECYCALAMRPEMELMFDKRVWRLRQ